jgi:beta-1,4-mannooligosaccharide phosphorylase
VSRRRFSVSWNQILSRALKFSSSIAENWPLGMLTIVRSSVRMRVGRSPMCITVPMWLPNRQKSPTKTGPSPITEMPPKRFSIVFCAASATASPPTPRPASVGDSWILQPEDPWEITGYVHNVVFTCGAVLESDGTVKIYWGGADTVMCVGEANVSDLVALCLHHGRPAK